jgi:RNA polymerase sigma factor (sigma-70 family)
MTTAPDPTPGGDGAAAERGNHVELLLARPDERIAAQEAQPAASASSSQAVRPDAQPSQVGGSVSGSAGVAADFADCYARDMAGLIWFVMSLGATAEVAADVAQSAFADAFPVWPTIRHPRAWLRRVAERGYYRRGSRETPVESPPERPGPLPTASAAELRDEARTVLAALAALPPKQRQVMAWCVDGYSPAEIARELGADPAAVRQNLAKARKNLKQLLGIDGSAR